MGGQLTTRVVENRWRCRLAERPLRKFHKNNVSPKMLWYCFYKRRLKQVPFHFSFLCVLKFHTILVISQALSNKEINYPTGQCCPLFILEWCVWRIKQMIRTPKRIIANVGGGIKTRPRGMTNSLKFLDIHRNRGNQKYVVHSELPTPHKLGVPLIQSRAERSGVALGFQRVLFRKVIVP